MAASAEHEVERGHWTPAAGRGEDVAGHGLQESWGSDDWAKLPPPGTSDGTLGGTEDSVLLPSIRPEVSGSCQAAGQRPRSAAAQLRQQLAHGIPQLVDPLELQTGRMEPQASADELKSQEAVQAALQKLRQLTAEATSLLPSPLQGAQAVSSRGAARPVPVHMQRTPSVWAQTAKTRHQEELEDVAPEASREQPECLADVHGLEPGHLMQHATLPDVSADKS
ncbi:hypothetical protein WJX84_005603 [Apatococcus fuscideae]|uniref:Uncharacterized protein n=1 Tax=Apatococcus fuscideae TaxID=2026836 RepID=A0AAW1SKS2_9CHLO